MVDVMDSYEQLEEDCDRIRTENEKLLMEFAEWLSQQKLAPKTINNHVNNVDFFINECLLSEEATPATDGTHSISYFLGYWFIRKAMWASQSSIRTTAASLKKFYRFMADKGHIPVEDYDDVTTTIKEHMGEWLDTMARYDDPSIQDMHKVWFGEAD